MEEILIYPDNGLITSNIFKYDYKVNFCKLVNALIYLIENFKYNGFYDDKFSFSCSKNKALKFIEYIKNGT